MLYKKVRVAGKVGVVVEVRDGFARVILEGEERWYPIEELEEVSVLDRLIRGELDDPMDFVLAMDAYRLDTEYKFNPYVLASSTKIEIFPHQIDEVTLMLDRPCSFCWRSQPFSSAGLRRFIRSLQLSG